MSQLSCLQLGTGAQMSTIRTAQCPMVLSPEQNAWVGLLEPHATAACMLDIPSLQPRFTFEKLPAEYSDMNLSLRWVAFSQDCARVASVWSTILHKDLDLHEGAQFGDKQRDEVLAIHASADGRLLVSFNLATISPDADIFAPAGHQDGGDFAANLHWFSNGFEWCPNSMHISALTLSHILIFSLDGSIRWGPQFAIGPLQDPEELDRIYYMGLQWSPDGNVLLWERRDRCGSHGLIWNFPAEVTIFSRIKENPDASDTSCGARAWISDRKCLVLGRDGGAELLPSESGKQVAKWPSDISFLPMGLQSFFQYEFSSTQCLLVGLPMVQFCQRLKNEDLSPHFALGTDLLSQTLADPGGQVHPLWHALVNTAMPTCRVIRFLKGACGAFAWHPSPSLSFIYAVASCAGEVLLVDGKQHQVVQEWEWQDISQSPFWDYADSGIKLSWSSDGSWLSVQGREGIRVIHFDARII